MRVALVEAQQPRQTERAGLELLFAISQTVKPSGRTNRVDPSPRPPGRCQSRNLRPRVCVRRFVSIPIFTDIIQLCSIRNVPAPSR